MSDLLRPTSEISLPKLAEFLRRGGMSTRVQFLAADMCDEAAKEISRLRQEVARLKPHGGWGVPW